VKSDKTSDYATVRERPELFVWGKAICWHDVGPYQILEHQANEFKDGRPTGGVEENSSFHVYVNRKGTSTSCASLDAALVYAIAYSRLEVNEARWMAEGANRLLRIGAK